MQRMVVLQVIVLAFLNMKNMSCFPKNDPNVECLRYITLRRRRTIAATFLIVCNGFR